MSITAISRPMHVFLIIAFSSMNSPSRSPTNPALKHKRLRTHSPPTASLRGKLTSLKCQRYLVIAQLTSYQVSPQVQGRIIRQFRKRTGKRGEAPPILSRARKIQCVPRRRGLRGIFSDLPGMKTPCVKCGASPITLRLTPKYENPVATLAAKFRRPLLSDTCPKCHGRIILTVTEGSVKKYLDV